MLVIPQLNDALCVMKLKKSEVLSVHNMIFSEFEKLEYFTFSQTVFIFPKKVLYDNVLPPID